MDIRTHFVYLCALFLLLGFGILIGESFYGPVQVHQQKRSLDALRVQAERAVQDGQQAKDALSKTDAALEALRPALVKGRLAGKRVVLIQTGDYSDATDAAASALTDAGASLAATVKLLNRWGTLDDARRDTEASALARALASPSSAPSALASLEDAGLVTVMGDMNGPAWLFVLVGGAKDEEGPEAAQPQVDAALIAALQAQTDGKASVVGCEPSGAGVSFVPVYQSAGVASVDCVDRPLGQLALPFALRGGADAGTYGIKATAERQVPPSLSGEGAGT